MHTENIIVPFGDTPEMEQITAAINGWQRAKLPDWWQRPTPLSGRESVDELAYLVRRSLAEIKNISQKSQLEAEVISWLYDFIRANVKRGRLFDSGDVLLQSSADCLGYAKLFTLLGRLLGLDAGIIEIVIDNAGRYVPHTACLVKLSDGHLRFVDLWYGSKNINHQRVGLQVKQGGTWRINDLELKELSSQEEVSYLPDSCVNAITRYILGNRHLDRQEFDSAIKCYSEAIRLYPGNARFLYNRAIVNENLGEQERADADYAQAVCDDTAVIRLLATEHDEIIGLLDLDAKGIDNQAQGIYLLYKGLATGKGVPLTEVAGRFSLSEAETKAILSSVEARLVTSSEKV